MGECDMKKQTIKIMTTLSSDPTKKTIADHLSVMIQKLLNQNWSLDINISEDGGCWEVSGYKNLE